MSAPAATPVPARRRRRPGPGWVPNQHGAWAMLLVPVVVGAGLAGPAPVHLLLLAAWLVAYLAFHAAGLWLRARRRARWWPPVRTYGLATAVLGGTLLVLEPALVWWAPLYLPLLAVSLRFSARRQDRALANDVVTMVAACLVTVVAYDVATGAGAVTDRPRLPDDAVAWTAAAVLLAYFVGTALYVKTMIRERGNPRMYAASVIYHAVIAAVSWPVLGSAPLTALFALLLVRAAVVPRAWPGATPKVLGIGEIVASAVLTLVLLTGV